MIGIKTGNYNIDVVELVRKWWMFDSCVDWDDIINYWKRRLALYHRDDNRKSISHGRFSQILGDLWSSYLVWWRFSLAAQVGNMEICESGQHWKPDWLSPVRKWQKWHQSRWMLDAGANLYVCFRVDAKANHRMAILEFDFGKAEHIFALCYQVSRTVTRITRVNSHFSDCWFLLGSSACNTSLQQSIDLSFRSLTVIY